MNVVQIFRGTTPWQWYIRVVSSNGETLATSEAYVSKWNAKRAARKNFPGLRVVEVEK